MSYEEPDYDDFEYEFTEFLGTIMTELRTHKEDCAPVIRLMSKITKKAANALLDFDELSKQIPKVCECMVSLGLNEKYDTIYGWLISAYCDVAEGPNKCRDCKALKEFCKLKYIQID